MIILLGTALLAAEPTTESSAPVASTEVASPAPAKVKEKKTCKVDDADSGSHMVKRLCLTEQQWQERGGKGMMNNSRAGLSGRPETN